MTPITLSSTPIPRITLFHWEIAILGQTTSAGIPSLFITSQAR